MSNAGTLSCQQVVDLVTEYFEGALAPPDRLAFEQHVAACPPCRAYFAQMRTVVRAAGTLREEELPIKVRDDLVEAFRNWKGAKG